MPNLKKIFAGLALGTAVAGGAVAMGATAASANDGPSSRRSDIPFFFKKSEDRPVAKGGAANGVDDSTGGIAQDNKKGDDFFPQAFAPNTLERNDRNHYYDDRNQNNWWDTNNWWGQNLYKDDRAGHDAFGLVAKDVAFGFQEKDDRDFNWLNSNWWADQDWWNHHNNDWWNRNDREHNNNV
ncbi:MAG: hypothetical protein IRZ07_10505 [Microbispora sp.]|nr:hypothetical protein [Microbispora sp.]